MTYDVKLMETQILHKVIQEYDLDRLVRCPLMTPMGPSKVELCAHSLANWSLHKSLEGTFPKSPLETLDLIRQQLIKYWKEYEVPGDPGYTARTAGFRLFNLMLDYEVIHTEQLYNLTLTRDTIQGKYAILKKRKGSGELFILSLYVESPPEKHEGAIPPNAVNMARYLHAVTSGGYKDIKVLNYPMLKGEHWIDKKFNDKLVTEYLLDMHKAIDLRYPVAGKHCSTCSTKPCLEVYNG